MDCQKSDVIRGVSCCGEVLLVEHYKGDNAHRQWLEDIYWPFAKRHSPSGPDEKHHWKFAVEKEGKLVIEYGS